MKNSKASITAIQIFFVLMFTLKSQAWKGDKPFQAIYRETILRTANQMIGFSWTPNVDIYNWRDGVLYSPFDANITYKGEAYSQHDPQDSWSEFYSKVNSVVFDKNTVTIAKIKRERTKLGNDCAGFVSISWKLPERYGTGAFASDAKKSHKYCTQLPNMDNLLPGDALVAGGSHMVLFHSYFLNDKTHLIDGINVLEQTRPKARFKSNFYSFSMLKADGYIPIRRNNLKEDCAYATQWGSTGSGSGQFLSPLGVAADPSGNVYVADTGNNRVQKFGSNGNYISQWYKGYDGFLSSPVSVAFNPLYSRVFVAEKSSKRIQLFDKDGNPTPLSTMMDYWNPYPTGLAIDSSGNYLFTTNASDTVYKIDVNKHYADVVARWGSPETGADGTLYVSNFESPLGTAIDTAGNLYVADTGNNQIQKFNSSNGQLLKKWGLSKKGQPSAIAVDSSNNVYVVDTGNNCIHQFNSNGDLIKKWGSRGSGQCQFVNPKSIATDGSGNVYVADTRNNRIQKFSSAQTKPPAGPNNFSGFFNKSSNTVYLSWHSNSDNVKGFVITRKDGIKGTHSVIATVGANSTNYADMNITVGTAYYYAVWAYNDSGDSNFATSSTYAGETVYDSVIVLYFGEVEVFTH